MTPSLSLSFRDFMTTCSVVCRARIGGVTFVKRVTSPEAEDPLSRMACGRGTMESCARCRHLLGLVSFSAKQNTQSGEKKKFKL